jgi:hypothetical protein
MRASSHRITAILAVLLAASGCSQDSAPRPPAGPTPQNDEPGPGRLPAVRTIAGRLVDLSGSPVAGAQIFGWTYGDSRLYEEATTATDGRFLIRSNADRFWFRRSGYETTSWSVPRDAPLDASFENDVRIQPALTAIHGVALSSEITGGDVTYSTDVGDAFAEGDYACSPCKFIRVPQDAENKTVSYHLTWSGNLPLSLWVGVQGTWSPPLLFHRKPGETEIITSVTEPFAVAVMVGVDPRRDPGHVSGSSTFTLTTNGR